MPARPTWSGSIQISLVSIAVRVFPATNPARQVEFHQIDRRTHHRVHHQNVADSGVPPPPHRHHHADSAVR
jgi:DNA end-binding protein Ku